jgi:hypothetical protein
MDEIEDESQFDEETQFDSFTIDSVKGKEATITLPVKPQNATGLKKATIKLKIDTGSSGNTVPMRIIRQMYKNDRHTIGKNLTQENVKLTAYNGRSIKYCGTIHMQLYRHGKWRNTKFYAIDTDNYRAPAILGLKTCEDLRIITVHSTDSIAESQPIKTRGDLKTKFPQQFDTIGNFDGELTPHPKDNAEPSIAAPRKCSLHKEGRIKAGLIDTEKKGINRRVSEQHRIQDQTIRRSTTSTMKTVLPPLLPGQHVRVLSQKNNRWFPGTIIDTRNAPRSYIIKTNGRTIRRNRGDIRPITPPRATTANRAPHATDTPTNNNRGAPQADPKPAANGDGGGRTGPTRSGRTPKPNPKYS